MIRQRDQEKEIELKKLSEVIVSFVIFIFSPLLLIIIVTIYHLVAS